MSADRKKNAPAEPAPPSFGDAMAELEGILERIEGEEIDVDQLAEELRRAAELLDLCRGKIRRAEVEVTQIVQRLEEDGGDGDQDAEPEPDDDDELEEDDIPF